jgi:N-methylhydantoinase B
MVDRIQYPAPGVLGGQPGAPGDLQLSSGLRPKPKTQVVVEPSQSVHLLLPGGGGRGDPLRRIPSLVLEDALAGYITPTGALRDYGVILSRTVTPSEVGGSSTVWVVDEDATLTERLRRQRAEVRPPPSHLED